MLQVLLGLGSKTDKHSAILLSAEFVEDIGGRFEVQDEVCGILFDFLRGDRFWTKVQGGRSFDDDIGVDGVVQNRPPHFLCSSNANDIGELELGRSGNQHDVCAPVSRGASHGKTHFARRAVADISDGIDVLYRGTGGHDDLPALEVAGPVQPSHNVVHDLQGRKVVVTA